MSASLGIIAYYNYINTHVILCFLDTPLYIMFEKRTTGVKNVSSETLVKRSQLYIQI